MQMHASCAARLGAGVLLLGPSGAGKSDLLLRLLDRGFELVADDQVVIEDGEAWAPETLAGLVEARGLGIVRLPYLKRAKLALVVELKHSLSDHSDRLPMPARYGDLDLPMVALDPWPASAPYLVELALSGAVGTVPFVSGAFS
jgi:HPr kinase/phosphorylase